MTTSLHVGLIGVGLMGHGIATSLLRADTMPLVFSFPVLPTTLDADGSDFEVTLNAYLFISKQTKQLLLVTL